MPRVNRASYEVRVTRLLGDGDEVEEKPQMVPAHDLSDALRIASCGPGVLLSFGATRVEHPKAAKGYVTKTGKVLTEADIEALADEAERGYDVEHLRGKADRRGVD